MVSGPVLRFLPLLALLLVCRPLVAESGFVSLPGFQSVSEPELAEAEKEELDPENPEHRQRVLTVSLALFILVGIIGVMLVVLVILWGHRLRRVSRTPPKKSAPLDPLWYLKGTNQPREKPAENKEQGEL